MTPQPEPNEVDRLAEVLEASGLDSFVENMKAADAAVERVKESPHEKDES